MCREGLLLLHKSWQDEPNVITYDALISTCKIGSLPERALQFFDDSWLVCSLVSATDGAHLWMVLVLLHWCAVVLIRRRGSSLRCVHPLLVLTGYC